MVDKQNNPDDAAGYGKPPKASQYKPGQSGNPKGRPKGARNLLKLISKHAARKVTVIEGGVEKKMPRIDVVISALFNKASKGDVSAARLLTNLILAASQLPGEDYQSGYSDEDLKVILEEANWQAQLVKLSEEHSQDEF